MGARPAVGGTASIGVRRSGRSTKARAIAMNLKTLALVSGRLRPRCWRVPMLFCRPQLARLFGAPPPVPLVNAQLNGVFTLSLAAGYFWAAGDAEARRGYFWVAGVLAKGLGALLFLWDHFTAGLARVVPALRGHRRTLALCTLALLLKRR